MNKRFGLGLTLVFGLASWSLSAQTFSVSYSKNLSAQPLDGRLFLLLSTDASAEPRFQIDDSPRSQIMFGVTVDGWAARQAKLVDASAKGYPIRSLKDLPPGEYTVQAVLNKYETFHRSDGKTVKLHPDMGEGQHWNISPGNLYSKPKKITIGSNAAAVSLELTEVIPPIKPPRTPNTSGTSVSKAMY